jgi:ribA/ribD-fused uncharacterized protein
MKTIKFYSISDQFGFFSNFAPYPIFLNGEVWRTVEHYFQANKFQDATIRKKIQLIESPMKAALEGRDRNKALRADWDNVKDDIMYEGLKSKFFQHPELRMEILKTNDALIVEHTNKDFYWGDGGDGSGKNKLGLLIMKVRDELKGYSDDIDLILPPWMVFPEIDQDDLFWRMGLGEDYLTQWAKFYLATDQLKYKEQFPPTEEWKDC